MRIVQILPTASSEFGGPVSMARLIHRSLRERGHEAILLPSESVKTLNVLGTTVYWPGVRGVRDITRHVRSADLAHIHGLWTLPAAVAGLAARRSDVPYVVTVHGALNEWSLSKKPWRKRLYARLVERRQLRRAAAVHVLTWDEQQALRRWRVDSPAFLLPNGIDLDEFRRLPGRSALNALYPRARGRMALLFLGRLAEEKGIDLLLSAFARARPTDENLHLFLAGPGSRETVDDLRASAERLSIQGRVTFTGEVRGEVKRRLLGGADVFVQLSHTEGDSVALKEAMGSGLPLLVSRGAAPGELEGTRAALITERDPGVVADSIRLLARNPVRRALMSRRAREWAGEHLDHVRIVEGLIAVYEDILRGTRTAAHWRT